MKLLRWGQSAYETDASLDLEARLLGEHGVQVHRYTGPRPPMQDVQLLAVTSKVRVDQALLAQAPQLQLVVTTTSGYDHIDVPACKRAGVVVSRSPMARRDAVVDTALAMGLSLLRQVPALQARAEQGRWARSELPQLPMRLVRGLRVGIVGQGVIGARAAEFWRVLGAEVLTSDVQAGHETSVDQLIESCGLLSLHCSLTPSSQGLISAARLDAMAPGTVLVNTARGGCVDVQALMDRPHVLAGLDVFPQEPFPELQALARRPGTLLLPHAAGYHVHLGEAVARELAQAVAAHVQGQPVPHVIT
ncbi:MAG: lactate dehydrogenase-like 2-hydroxyacid dehydrogenase [Cognaticolwellia sp.]|jgi:lactate dehydrogenase-like 2-hydroxyacid dehydrogenase